MFKKILVYTFILMFNLSLNHAFMLAQDTTVPDQGVKTEMQNDLDKQDVQKPKKAAHVKKHHAKASKKKSHARKQKKQQ